MSLLFLFAFLLFVNFKTFYNAYFWSCEVLSWCAYLCPNLHVLLECLSLLLFCKGFKILRNYYFSVINIVSNFQSVCQLPLHSGCFKKKHAGQKCDAIRNSNQLFSSPTEKSDLIRCILLTLSLLLCGEEREEGAPFLCHHFSVALANTRM